MPCPNSEDSHTTSIAELVAEEATGNFSLAEIVRSFPAALVSISSGWSRPRTSVAPPSMREGCSSSKCRENAPVRRVLEPFDSGNLPVPSVIVRLEGGSN